jgi:Cu+-exporting ATPase
MYDRWRIANLDRDIDDVPMVSQIDRLGTGARVAIESAGFALIKGNLDGLVRAGRLLRVTMRNIRQNLRLALISLK